MMNEAVFPVGVAIHTRGHQHGEDYSWYAKVGYTRLFNKIVDIHRIGLRDVEGETPRLVVTAEKSLERIGFLIGSMSSTRTDHVSRVINNTLYLEFGTQDQRSIFNLIAVLLASPEEKYKQYVQHFNEYAEQFYKQGQNFLQGIPLSWSNSAEMELLEQSIEFEEKELAAFALPYDEEHRNQCTRYLTYFASSQVNSFCFVSTGRVGIEKCQQIANMSDECIVLTQSAEVQKRVNLKQNTLSTKLLSYSFSLNRYISLKRKKK